MGRPRIQDTVCAIEGCRRLTQAWNRCSPHYEEWRRGLSTWPIEHGTLNAYSNLKCRCRDCSTANTEQHGIAYVKVGLGYGQNAVDVPFNEWQRVRDFAAQQNRSIRSLAREAIREYMERHA